MLETVAGRYNPVELVSPQDQEDLDEGYTSVDDMDELSDSHSTVASHSRPTTPSDLAAHPHPRVSKSKSRHRSSTTESESEPPHFAVASKASLILGLVPGTLPHAMACLENARDEARRLFDVTSASSNGYTAPVEETKKGGGRMDRARKAMSIALPSSGSMAKLAAGMGAGQNVILGIGGAEEEMKRERRRRVADGVLHWQKEVQRLREAHEAEMAVRQREMGALERKGTRKGRR